MELSGKSVLVLGLGESGLAMAKWLYRQGVRLHLADSRQDPPQLSLFRQLVPQAVVWTGPFAVEAVEGIDLIAISPGVPLDNPLVDRARTRKIPLVSEIELFSWAIRRLTPTAKVIAITGSNGKTTTTALTGALCRAAGLTTCVAGNIGPAALDALMEALDTAALPSVWVLELSSFQLDTTYTLAADAATLLNVSEDHLDRYAGFDDYAASKMRVFQGAGAMILNRDDPYSGQAARSDRRVISFGLDPAPQPDDYGVVDHWLCRGDQRLLALRDLRLVGRHNAANALAALALCEAIGIAPQDVLPALAAFQGLAHRVEWVAHRSGVDFYDDSKGTNVGATLAALQGLGRPVAIILGGEGKGQDFSPLRAAVAAHARAVALLGRDAPAIKAVLEDCGVPFHDCLDMAEAVGWCAAQACPGDAVLLSPACASMDMYRNYAHRAEAFIDAVRDLGREAA
ncbi:MAG TPA: UDP-N-acetylmuramoyl-L-alanine--D-glutamate ligase [Accumulibacter sp.]|nr:UDP-N-acetylmuramoyl-L-alanine--D-glutamate ligase [Accumulibacter sp.]HMW16252.1 UDP-N-acetylmuramoyl-L-alanine--D-glutamate ligase [Accumulibacter sp.]HMY05631.1 UDP-N-acetylmuramoyl-L-alanine--D-glutamate ligase [Accumulibacter sp.]HNC16763.1 UDP-N-acetylmuramoyl-L-alanine--D-glutamate ligase [Accumulibacter sp.]HND79551.1 UDP-N-acetylmuramoyl-L-alanine--D-glutamate ligase [Accumulibacter sp.]